MPNRYARLTNPKETTTQQYSSTRAGPTSAWGLRPNLTFSLTLELVAALDKIVRQRGSTRNTVVERLLRAVPEVREIILENRSNGGFNADERDLDTGLLKETE